MSAEQKTYKVTLHYGPYEGTEYVTVDPDTEEDTVKAIAWGRARRAGLLTLPMAATTASVEEV